MHDYFRYYSKFIFDKLKSYMYAVCIISFNNMHIIIYYLK